MRRRPPRVRPSARRRPTPAPAPRHRAGRDGRASADRRATRLGGHARQPRRPARAQQNLVRASSAGSAFVASGPGDCFGSPLGTIPRLARRSTSSDTAAVASARVGTGRRRARAVPAAVRSGPLHLRQRQRNHSPGRDPAPDQHPHRSYPAPSRARSRRRLERERQRVIRFLRDEGYFEANVASRPVHTGRPRCGRLRGRVARTRVPDRTHLHLGEYRDPHRQSSRCSVTAPVQLWTGPVPFTVRRMRDDMARWSIATATRAIRGPACRAPTTPSTAWTRRTRTSRWPHIHERKHVTVSFEGNDNKSCQQAARPADARQARRYDDFEVGNSADAIQRFYQDEGYFFARVHGDASGGPPTRSTSSSRSTRARS